jgi:7-carboxy-7-deazaguanine synthase
MLNLSELFFSIQGESTYSGLPCIFIRLAGCNLRCDYCDSEYSYNTKFKMSVEEIILEIGKFSPVKLVEITGGEPLLQQEVFSLMAQLIQRDYSILLETNGSISLKDVPEQVIKIVDIKCPTSGYSDTFLEDNIHYIERSKDEIKFVLMNRADYEWVKDRIEKFELSGYKVILSPVFSSLEPKQLAHWVITDKLNVRIQLQMHKYIWEPETRGV